MPHAAGFALRALLALLLCAAPALAQEKPKLRLAIDGVGSEASACGIGEPAIQAVGTRTLKALGIPISSDPSDPYVYINVNAYRVTQGADVVGCAMRLGVSVRAAVPDGAVRGLKPKGQAYLVLCEAGRLLSGAQRDLAAAVSRALEEDLKACFRQVEY
jgi:hypothetical protein